MHHPHISLKKMQETTLHSSPSFPKYHHPFPKHPHSYSSSFPKPPLPILRSSLRSPPTITQKPPPLTSPHFHSTSPHLREKLLFLDSVGLDHLSLIQSHPSISTAPLSNLKSTVHFLTSLSLTSPDLRRILGICPQILTSDPQTLTSIVTFLLREAGVDFLHLRHVIHRRPRLLLSDVATRLRPTLYFLQMLGISPISRHTYLLSCSVEEKLIPRLDFLQDSGFTPKEARLMVRRFPAMFCYGIEGNLARKLGFLVEEMGRGLGEVREFPQYFSYSLERRIRKRHLVCEAKRVMFTLPALLRPSDEEFRERVEVCVGSSPPLRGSPLWQHIPDQLLQLGSWIFPWHLDLATELYTCVVERWLLRPSYSPELSGYWRRTQCQRRYELYAVEQEMLLEAANIIKQNGAKLGSTQYDFNSQ